MGPEESWRIVESQWYAIADIMEALNPTRWELPAERPWASRTLIGPHDQVR
ncbi:MAG: hypothetical protein K0S98_1437 [Propionibacteriaceae bacterium]|nr:hypothetical protein [Propionibacteriaceae bacterium]